MSKELLKQWIEHGWLNGELDTVESILPATFSIAGLPASEHFPREEFPELVELFRRLTGPGEIKIINIIEDTPWYSATFKLIAKPATQLKPIAIDVFLVAKFESGRMTEHYTGFDYFSLFSQLGQIPENSLEHCLLGGNLTWT